MESGSTVSSFFGRSPNLQLISHFGSFDAPVKTKLGIHLSLSLIANRHAHEVKLLVHSCNVILTLLHSQLAKLIVNILI